MAKKVAKKRTAAGKIQKQSTKGTKRKVVMAKAKRKTAAKSKADWK